MREPALMMNLRSRKDPDSLKFVEHYERFKTLLLREPGLCPMEMQELCLLRQLIRRSLALWIEKR